MANSFGVEERIKADWSRLSRGSKKVKNLHTANSFKRTALKKVDGKRWEAQEVSEYSQLLLICFVF